MFTNVPDLSAYTRCAGKATERDDATCQLSHLSLVNLMLHKDEPSVSSGVEEAVRYLDLKFLSFSITERGVSQPRKQPCK